MQFTLRQYSPTPPTSHAPPAAPSFIKTGKKKTLLSNEPFRLSPWRLPFFNRAPQWFRTYTHLSIIGFAAVGALQWWNWEDNQREKREALTRPRNLLYAKPSYSDESSELSGQTAGSV